MLTIGHVHVASLRSGSCMNNRTVLKYTSSNSAWAKAMHHARGRRRALTLVRQTVYWVCILHGVGWFVEAKCSKAGLHSSFRHCCHPPVCWSVPSPHQPTVYPLMEDLPNSPQLLVQMWQTVQIWMLSDLNWLHTLCHRGCWYCFCSRFFIV